MKKTWPKGYGSSIVAVGPHSVVKFDGHEEGFSVKQAMHMKLLGKSVCPEVLAIFGDGYSMERVYDPPLRDLAWARITIRSVLNLLCTRVWGAQPFHNFQWERHLTDWARTTFGIELGSIIANVHPETTIAHGDRTFSTTHGDPTLANVMYRGEELVLIDPLPPKDRIPSIRVVDIAKVAQSVIGWEHAAHGWSYYGSELVAPFFEELDTMNTQRGESKRLLFWLTVHLLRASRRISDPSHTWAKTRAFYLYNLLTTDKEPDLCSTLTILTARSPTLAKRSTRRTKR